MLKSIPMKSLFNPSWSSENPPLKPQRRAVQNASKHSESQLGSADKVFFRKLRVNPDARAAIQGSNVAASGQIAETPTQVA